MDEIAFAWVVQAADHSDENLDLDQFMKLSQGLANNLPAIHLDLHLSKSEKRRAIAKHKLSKPLGVGLDEMPLIGLSPNLHDHLYRYSRKILCALFYRVKDRIAPPNYRIWTETYFAAHGDTVDAILAFESMAPLMEIGQRRNVDLGNRFGYRYNFADDPDLLLATIYFGNGLRIAGILIDPESAGKLDHNFKFISIENMLLSSDETGE